MNYELDELQRIVFGAKGERVNSTRAAVDISPKEHLPIRSQGAGGDNGPAHL